MKRYSLIIILLVLLLEGCSHAIVKEPYDLAKQFLEDQGYTILSHEKSIEPFILTNSTFAP